MDRPIARCPRLGQDWLLASVVAPFYYEAPLDGHIQAMKFRPSRPMGRALGQLLADHVQRHGIAAEVHAMVPVPLHRKRFLERGFNQAMEIARPVATGTGLPVLIRGIGRQTDTQPQTRLAARERHANLRGAFAVRRDLQGMSVAIVDDVITTSATVNALAASLRDAGAREVHAWALARAVPGSGSRQGEQRTRKPDQRRTDIISPMAGDPGWNSCPYPRKRSAKHVRVTDDRRGSIPNPPGS